MSENKKGRKPRDGKGPADHRVNIRLTKEEHDEAKKRAAGGNMSDYFRSLIGK
jgi:hypothetical protein